MLVIGGGWFLGREIVACVIGKGCDVTVFSRGRTAAPPPGVSWVRGDREDRSDLRQLARRGPWDAVIDVPGSVPAVVRESARILSAAASRYVFVSTVSVYQDWPYVPVDESSRLWPADPDYDPGTRAWDADAYGPLKAGCELAVLREFGADRSLFVRCHVLLGPGEYVGRLPSWLRRIREGGRVLAPAPPSRSIQPADVRDAAAFTAGLAWRQVTGVFNVAAPAGRDTYGAMLDSCNRVTGGRADITWADERWLEARQVRQWTELPLWRTLPDAWTMSTARAQAAGLQSRPLHHTVSDTWDWLRCGGEPVGHERAAEHGISRERETQLLAEWDRHLVQSDPW